MAQLGYDTRPKAKEPEDEEVAPEEEGEEEQEEKPEEPPMIKVLILLKDGEQFEIEIVYNAPILDLKLACQQKLKEFRIRM